MGLEAFTPMTKTVPLPDGAEFTVRGLSLEDITIILREHYKPIKALWDKYVAEATVAGIDKATGGELDIASVEGVVLEGLEAAPGLIGDLIARAADETEHPEKARKLPVSVQIEAIEKIVALTLEAEGGMEKLVESVSRLAGSLTELTASPSS